MEKLTFKQYLDSREQLLEAIKRTPVAREVHNVRKYCSLALGESDNDSTSIKLKPKQQLVVEWLYEDINNPTPRSVRVVGVDGLNENVKHDVFWTGTKLRKWLIRHATKDQNRV